MATTDAKIETMADVIENYFAARDKRVGNYYEALKRLEEALKKTGPVLAKTPPNIPPDADSPLPDAIGGPPGMSVFRYSTRRVGDYEDWPIVDWTPMPVPEGCPLAADVSAPG